MTVAGRVAAHCDELAGLWPDLIEVSLPSSSRPGGGTTARIQDDDESPSEGDIDVLTRIVSLRREIGDQLTVWAGRVARTRGLTAGKALPLQRDIPTLTAFLARHTEWLAAAHPADAARLEQDLRLAVRRVRAVVDPYRREWVQIGECPFVDIDVDGLGWSCTGRVRTRIGDDDGLAVCSGCGRQASIEWWLIVLGIGADLIVTVSELVRELYVRLHIRVTDWTIRRWARDGLITAWVPYGPQPRKPAWRFELRAVLDQVARMDRPCAICGRPWSGQGPTCRACYRAIMVTPLRLAEPRNSYPTKRVPTSSPTRPASQSVAASRWWCEEMDMPAEACGCERHRRGLALILHPELSRHARNTEAS